MLDVGGQELVVPFDSSNMVPSNLQEKKKTYRLHAQYFLDP